MSLGMLVVLQAGKNAAQIAADRGFRVLAVMFHNHARLLQLAAVGNWGNRQECLPS